MNTGISTGAGMIDAWWGFRNYMAETDDPPVSVVVRALGDMAYFHELDEQPSPWVDPVIRGEAGLELDLGAADAYDAPFHTSEAKAGARQWPSHVATDPDVAHAEIGRRANDALEKWEKPAFVLYSDRDPITHSRRDVLRELIPTAGEQPDIWIEGAGHFLQEEAGEEVAEQIVEFVDRT
jgi:haloalkane dehalogenase